MPWIGPLKLLVVYIHSDCTNNIASCITSRFTSERIQNSDLTTTPRTSTFLFLRLKSWTCGGFVYVNQK